LIFAYTVVAFDVRDCKNGVQRLRPVALVLEANPTIIMTVRADAVERPVPGPEGLLLSFAQTAGKGRAKKGSF
jgi:hypothetical protein